MLSKTAKRCLTQTMCYATRRKSGTPGRRLDQLGKIPQRPAARVGDEVLHADDRAGLECTRERWMDRDS
jgi:hypothetical protein